MDSSEGSLRSRASCPVVRLCAHRSRHQAGSVDTVELLTWMQIVIESVIRQVCAGLWCSCTEGAAPSLFDLTGARIPRS
jgi:hypothetical protein